MKFKLPQYSIRMLLVAIAIAAISASWITNRIQSARIELATFNELVAKTEIEVNWVPECGSFLLPSFDSRIGFENQMWLRTFY